MLSKEECEQALMNICSSNSIIEDRKVFKDLINEHFEPQPYKFEDLKADMYLYDAKKNEIIYLAEQITIESRIRDINTICIGNFCFTVCNQSGNCKGHGNTVVEMTV